jgi:PKD repeat protein
MVYFKNSFLSMLSVLSISMAIVGCGGTSSSDCCQEEVKPKLSEKVSEIHKVVAVPEGNETIVYVDRNITVIQYVDRNITVIEYVDRNITVEVIKERPIAEISGLTDGSILTDNQLTISGIDSLDDDGNVTKYQWTIDDQNISTEKNPTIDLPIEEGIHKLCLTVTDNDNLDSKIVCKSFTIPNPNQDPTAVISGLGDKLIKTVCPVEVSADNTIAPDAEISTYLWTIDDNITLSGIDQNLSFNTVGQHKVCLKVTDTNDLQNEQCSEITVQDHIAPTPKITLTDMNGIEIQPNPVGEALIENTKYNFSCAGSVDDCNMTQPMTCEWNAHSYRIDANGDRVDYVNDCINHNNSPKIGEESWINLCPNLNRSKYEYIEIVLKITDQFGKVATQTNIYEAVPNN